MDREEHELTKSGEWFRDRLQGYLAYGGAAFTAIIGWLLSSDTVISLAHDADADKREAAITLAVLLPVLWLVWYTVILGLRSRCPDHPTVISRRYLHLYAIAVAIAMAALWCLVADVF